MLPDFCDIKHVKLVGFSCFNGHYLHLERPRRKVALLDGIAQISCSVVWINPLHSFSFCTSKILDALISFEVVFNPEGFTVFGVPFVSVASVPIHVTIGSRSASVRKKNRYLMQRFRSQRKKVPKHVCIFQVCSRIAFLSVDEIRKFQRITNKEYRGVISNKIIITIFF